MEVMSKSTKPLPSNRTSQVESFYERVTQDYQYWDTENMHFGYCSRASDFFSLRKMIRQMNALVLKKFQNLSHPTLLDAGCGIGGTMCYASDHFPQYHIYGITLSQYQKNIGSQKLNALDSLNAILCANYENIPAPDDTFDGAYAIESLCHSGSSAKAIQEIYRTLKPHSKLIIADAYIKKNKISKAAHWLKSKMEKNWELEEIISTETLQERLIEAGFKNIKIKELTWQVAPSVLYSIPTFIRFYASKIFQIKSTDQASHNNAWASLYSLGTAAFTRSFGYFLIEAEK